MLCPHLIFAQVGLGLTVSAPASVELGTNIHYQITVINQSGLDLNGIDVINSFPGSLQFVGAQSNRGPVSVSSGRVTLTISNINVSEQVPLFLDLRPTTTGTVANTVTLSRLEQPIATNVATTRVTGGTPTGSDVTISITPPPSSPTIFVDDWVSYSITVSKPGSGSMAGVVVTNTTTPDAIFRRFSAGGSVSGSTLRFNLGTLSLQSTQLHVTIQPQTATNYVLRATVSSTGDPNPSNNLATSTITVSDPVLGQLTARTNSVQRFNPQTGLVDQLVLVSNTDSTSTVASARVIITNFPFRLYNAVGTNDGHPFVVHGGSLEPTQSVELLLEYLIPDRTPKDNPGFTTYSAGPIDLSASSGGSPVAITNIVMRPPRSVMTNHIMLQFPSTTGARYQILYSSNSTFSPAFRAEPSIKAPANWVQWIDYGPPKTLSRPVFSESPTNTGTNANMRFYRAIQLP